MAVSLRYVEDGGELDRLEPLWNALQEHHVRVTPELDAQTPKRELAEAWRIRRSKYARWIEDPETFFVLAEEDGTTSARASAGPSSSTTAAGRVSAGRRRGTERQRRTIHKSAWRAYRG